MKRQRAIADGLAKERQGEKNCDKEEMHMDEEDEASSDFDVIENKPFEIGVWVRMKKSGDIGFVVSIDADGDLNVKFCGSDKVTLMYAKDFVVIREKICQE